MSSRGILPRSRLKHCAYCDRVFTKVEHLKRHQRSHTGERPFKCDVCGRSYARSDVLFRHFQTHGDNGQRITNTVESSPRDSILSPNDQSRRRSTDDNDDTTRCHDLFSTKAPTSSVDRRASGLSRGQRLASSPSRCYTASDQQACPPQPLQQTLPSSPLLMNVHRDQSQQYLIDADTCTTLNSYFTHGWGAAGQDSHEDLAAEYTSGIPPLPKTSIEDVAKPNEAFPNTTTRTIPNQVSAHEPAQVHSPRQQQMIPNEVIRESLDTSHHEQDDSVGNPRFGVSQSYGAQLNVESSSTFHHAGNNHEDTLQEEHSHVYDYGFEGISLSTEFRFSPDMMDCMGFGDAIVRSPTPDSDRENISTPPMTFSVEQLQKMQCLWSRQKPKRGVRLGRDLWHYVARHEADNIFSKPQASSRDPNHPLPRGRRPSRWCMDEECRKGLIAYCEEMDDTPDSPEGLKESSWVSDDNLPTVDVLDSSLDFFFQFFHPSFPFMHKSTFDARTTPACLLLPVCLVGLSYLDRKRATAFIIRCLQRLMRSCSNDLSCQAVGQCPPCELLRTLASTSLVVYLALGFRNELDERIAHSLCVQMLHITEKHGLFASGHGVSLALQLQHGPSDPEGAWMAWSRVESIKRMIICLLWLDMAYTRLMDTAGAVEMDKVVVHLPCEDALFEATTSTAFLQAAEHGTQLTMPQMNIRKFHEVPPSALNHISAQTILRALYLQAVAARVRLAETTQFSKVYPFNAAEAFSMDFRAKDIIASISTLSTTYASVINGRNTSTALGWNYLCLILTADLDLLEAASGRDGLEAASVAVVQVSKWSRSAGARRAVLHAAQIFDVLNSSRIRESHITRPDLVLFVSALVLGLYTFVSSHEVATPAVPPFELIQKIDWATVDGEGLASATGSNPTTAASDGVRQSDMSNPARRFIQYGGPITFTGEFLQNGRVAARKVLLQYAHLLDDFGKWDNSRYSQLLTMMCDFMGEDI